MAILDNLEQRIPKKWLKKANSQFKAIVQVLGKYLKAELILVLISFIIVTISLYIFKAVRYEYRFTIFNFFRNWIC